MSTQRPVIYSQHQVYVALYIFKQLRSMKSKLVGVTKNITDLSPMFDIVCHQSIFTERSGGGAWWKEIVVEREWMSIKTSESITWSVLHYCKGKNEESV